MPSFKLSLSIGQYKGSSMSLCVSANGKTIFDVDSTDKTKLDIEFECDLPTEIIFDVGNKGPMDTLVDSNGKIIQDKFVQVDNVIVDRLPVKKWILESRLFEFTPTTGATLQTNCFSYNGRAVLSLPEKTSFDFMLRLLTTRG